LRDPYTVSYPIAWVEHDFIALRKTGKHFRDTLVPVADPNRRRTRLPVLDGEHGPFIAFSEQSAERHRQRIVCIPHCHVDDDAVIVTKSRPCFRRINKVDGDSDPLFLNSQRRNLEKSGRVNPCDEAAYWRSSPAINPHASAGFDLDGVGRQEICDHFEIERVTDFDQRRARLNDGLTLLNDLEHTAGHRRPDIDTTGRIGW
jgi:hypothetical protein